MTAVALASVASSAQAAGLAVTASAHGTLASAAGAWGHVAAVLQATRVGVDAAVVGVRVLLEGEAAACTTTPHATALGFGFLALVACVLIAVGRMRHGTEQRRLDLARHMVELGQAPPAELLAGPVRNDLRRGIVLVFAGLGLGLTAGVTGDAGLAPGGLIPGFIGLGYLVSYYLAGGRLAAPGRSFASGGSPPVGSGPHVREGGPS